MFKERIHFDRENRVRQRGKSAACRKESRYIDNADNAGSGAVLSEHKLIQLYKAALRKYGRKDTYDCCPDTDHGISPLELKDNEIRALESELYSISLKLSLYLNAGLVLSAALGELIKDMRDEETPAAKLFLHVYEGSRNKNVAFEAMLFEAAKKIKSKDLLRFSLLLIDSRDKGSELCEKLERERLQMQNSRLSDARGRAKVAETKLCFPLMLLLVALVAICIAPAVMNM